MNTYVVCLDDGTTNIVNMRKEKLRKIKGSVCAYGPFRGKEQSRANWVAMEIKYCIKEGKQFNKEPSVILGKGKGKILDVIPSERIR